MTRVEVRASPKDEKAIRYEAQIIAQKHRKTLADAPEIAWTSLPAKEVTDNRLRGKKRSEKWKKIQRKIEGPKRSEYIYKLHGPLLPLGLPGLGKRK